MWSPPSRLYYCHLGCGHPFRGRGHSGCDPPPRGCASAVQVAVVLFTAVATAVIAAPLADRASAVLVGASAYLSSRYLCAPLVQDSLSFEAENRQDLCALLRKKNIF